MKLNWGSREEEETFDVLRKAISDVESRANVEILPQSEKHGAILSVSPQNDRAAQLQAHIENAGQVDLTIGRGLLLEILQGHSDRRRFLALLGDLIRAVANGRVEETAWMRGGEAVKAKGTITLENGEKHQISYRSGLGLGGEPLQTSYEPY